MSDDYLQDIAKKAFIQGNTLNRLTTQSLDYRDDIISLGMAFYVDYEQASIASSAKTYAQVTTPSDKYVALIDRELTTDQERLFYKVYTSYDPVTLGAAIPIGNLRGDSPFTTGTTVNECSTPASIDTSSVISIVPVFGAVGVGNRESGGISKDSVFRLVPPSTTILYEWENQSSDSIYCKTMLAWFELPESVIL